MTTDADNTLDGSQPPATPPQPAASNGHEATRTGGHGTVKWFNEKKGFGFIVDPNVPTDIFVHFSAISADGFRTLTEGDQVTYELYNDDKGAKARNVVRL